MDLLTKKEALEPVSYTHLGSVFSVFAVNAVFAGGSVLTVFSVFAVFTDNNAEVVARPVGIR